MNATGRRTFEARATRRLGQFPPAWVGTRFTGRVADVDGEHIATEFLWFIVPLLPLRSVYVVGEDVQTTLPGLRQRLHQHVDGYPLRLSWASVGLGWLGAVALLAALLGGFLVVGQRNAGGLVFLAGAALLFGLVHLARRARGPARLGRQLLAAATGLRARPEWLPPPLCREVRDALEVQWRATHKVPAGERWVARAASPRLGVREVDQLYALAAYSAAIGDTPGADVWARHLLARATPQRVTA